VVGKAEHLPQGANPRFVVTNSFRRMVPQVACAGRVWARPIRRSF
jgi:hypothetical protein